MLTYKFPLHRNVNMCVFTIGIFTKFKKENNTLAMYSDFDSITLHFFF